MTKWLSLTKRGHHPLLFVDATFRAFRDSFHSYYGLPNINTIARHSGCFFIDKNQYHSLNKAILKKLSTNWPKQVADKQLKDFIKIRKVIHSFQTKTEISKLDIEKFYTSVSPLLICAQFPIFVG